jgi:uncharacterized protein
MKILIDVGHPAHVHIFKHFAWKMQRRGHEILFTCIEKENVLYLLSAYKFKYKNFGRHYKSIIGKIFGLIQSELKMFAVSIYFKPHIYLSAGSICASHVAWLLGKPHITMEDTFNMEQVKLYLPFSAVVLTGNYPHRGLGNNEIQYPGYHELAYLHPNLFKADSQVLNNLRIGVNEKFAIVRFVAWNASHDIGHNGISLPNKIKLVQELSKYLKVFISSEDCLPSQLKKYQIKIKPEEMHDIIRFSQLLIGESGTMASEAAMVGTPAIFLNNIHFGCIDDQADYGLIYTFTESEDDQEQAIDKAIELARKNNSSEYYIKLRDDMLKDKINVTEFLIWFVENYPKSKMKIRKPGFSFNEFK